MRLKKRVKLLEEKLIKTDKELNCLKTIVKNITKNSKPPKFKYKIGEDVEVNYSMMLRSVKIVHRTFNDKTFENIYTLGFSNGAKDFTENEIRKWI